MSQTHRLMAEFVRRFKARRGTIVCNELLGVDLAVGAGWREAADKGLFESVCPGVVRDAAQILDGLLATRAEDATAAGPAGDSP